MNETLAELLRLRLDYNPNTGVFTWKNGRRKGFAAGSLTPTGYITIRLGKQYEAQRLAWFAVHGDFPKAQIDHINGITTDNRIVNLRVASHAENQQNRKGDRSDSKTGVIGVSARRSGFLARIKVNKREIHLGCFETAEEAHAAYLAAKKRLHPFTTI
jgi:hypothetical protein